MQTKQERLAYGPMVLDWEERINMERLRRERPAKARAKMKERGYAAMILGEGNNRRYAVAIEPGGLSDFIPGVSGFSILFTDYPDDSIDFSLEGNLAKQAQRHCTWLKQENIRTCHSLQSCQAPSQVEENAKITADEVYRDLKALKVEKEKIGYDGMNPLMLAELEAKGLKMVRDPELMVEARAKKTQDEINCMKMVGNIANQGFWEIYNNLRPGASECEVASHVAAAFMRMANRGGYFISLRSGPNTAPNWLSHSPTDRIIQPGDLVFCDMIGPLFLSYRSCYYRTFKCGLKPTQKEKDWYKKCYEWLNIAADTLRAGIETSEVANKWPPASTWGFKEEYECWTNALGHGIGLTQYEPPMIGRSFHPQPIEAGQTIALETWFGENGVGGCRIENIYVVNEKGCENLYTWPDEEIVVPEHSLLIR